MDRCDSASLRENFFSVCKNFANLPRRFAEAKITKFSAIIAYRSDAVNKKKFC